MESGAFCAEWEMYWLVRWTGQKNWSLSTRKQKNVKHSNWISFQVIFKWKEKRIKQLFAKKLYRNSVHVRLLFSFSIVVGVLYCLYWFYIGICGVLFYIMYFFLGKYVVGGTSVGLKLALWAHTSSSAGQKQFFSRFGIQILKKMKDIHFFLGFKFRHEEGWSFEFKSH